MSRKNILNLFLFIIFFALASLIYFSKTEVTKLDVLSDLDISSINIITIQHNNAKTIIEKQNNNQWVITKPVNIDANNFRINSILKLINAPVHSHYAPTEIDLSRIDLDTPVTSISFNNDRVLFGSINPATGLRYVQYKNTIYTLEDVYFPFISSHFSTLVSLNLIPTGNKVSKLILLNQIISKNKKDLWQSNISITADNVAKAIDSWQTTQAFGIHQYLERKALGDVFVYTENQPSPINYQITDVDPWLIIARPELGLEYHLNLEVYDQLITPQ